MEYSSVCFVKEDVMIKNTARITLALVAFVSLLLSVWNYSVNFSFPVLFENMISSGLLLHRTQRQPLYSNNQTVNLPYMYINLPIYRDYPSNLDYQQSQMPTNEN